MPCWPGPGSRGTTSRTWRRPPRPLPERRPPAACPEAIRHHPERFGKNYLRIKLDCTLTYQEAGDEYWLRSNGEENIEVCQPDGSWVPATLTDPDGEHPGISIKFSARPGSGNYNFGNYARMAKLADEQGMVHGPIPSAGEIETAPSGRLRDRGFFAKCPSCGYTKR